MPNTKVKKRDITRKRVIKSAIDCIYREGFHAANTNKIAAEAGVSWGVLQYHFGDKDALLLAVIDYIFDEFFTSLGQVQFIESTDRGAKDLHQEVMATLRSNPRGTLAGA